MPAHHFIPPPVHAFPHSLPAVCRVALEVHDPVCKNGGYLRAENHTDEATSCADCICPEGWTGADCACEGEGETGEGR